MRNRYRDSYRKTTGVDGRGKAITQYVYNGEFYILPFDRRQKRKTNLINAAFTAVMAVLLVLDGMVNQDSSRTFWVVYPYIFIYLPLLFLLLGVVSYMDCGTRIQVDQYDKSIRRIRRSVWGVIVLSAIAAVCDVVFLVLYHDGIQLGREVIYLAGLLLTAAAGIGYGFCYDRMFAGITVEN